MIGRTIRSHLPYFCVSLAVYGICFAFGAVIVSEKLTIHPTSMAFWPILAHNFMVGAILMFGGWFTLGVVNTVYLAYNAAMLGAIVKGVMKGYGLHPIITGILPHGITEIMSHLLFCTLGYETWRLLHIVKKRARAEQTEPLHIRDVVLLFAAASVLLVISALIEATVSHA
ncbi:stage II sporulation protein M [Anoxybacillus kestanbolensis]|uniref:stage II sporulation protein M n=1 Tax=Anoxybacillus kestanbolensis TaxID=227476 RepID=UPI003D1B5BE7